MLTGLLVFAFTYLLVATRQLRFARLDRPAGAIVGAVLAVAVGAITPEDAVKAVDHTTIILLFAVMGMGDSSRSTAFSTERAVSSSSARRRAGGSPVRSSGGLASSLRQ
jgi:Na+/H+ antiporter NhaD/arsenite permease-like protein